MKYFEILVLSFGLVNGTLHAPNSPTKDAIQKGLSIKMGPHF